MTAGRSSMLVVPESFTASRPLPDGGGHGDRCRRLVLDVFREAVVDQGGEEGAGFESPPETTLEALLAF